MDDYQHLRESADAAGEQDRVVAWAKGPGVREMLMGDARLAASFDPRPDDDARYETAIARRNRAHVAYREATGLLDAVVARGVRDPDLRPYIGNVNETQRDLEHAERDLIRARVVWREHRAEGRRG